MINIISKIFLNILVSIILQKIWEKFSTRIFSFETYIIKVTMRGMFSNFSSEHSEACNDYIRFTMTFSTFFFVNKLFFFRVIDRCQKFHVLTLKKHFNLILTAKKLKYFDKLFTVFIFI